MWNLKNGVVKLNEYAGTLCFWEICCFSRGKELQGTFYLGAKFLLLEVLNLLICMNIQTGYDLPLTYIWALVQTEKQAARKMEICDLTLH